MGADPLRIGHRQRLVFNFRCSRLNVKISQACLYALTAYRKCGNSPSLSKKLHLDVDYQVSSLISACGGHSPPPPYPAQNPVWFQSGFSFCAQSGRAGYCVLGYGPFSVKFLDEAKIFIKSGDGGNGCVSFRREICGIRRPQWRRWWPWGRCHVSGCGKI